MKRRSVTDDEKTLFRKAVDTTRPQVIAKAKTKKPAAKAKPGGTERGQEKCAAVAYAAARQLRPAARPIQKDLDGNTRERLKRGGVRPQASMDLHGMTQAAAHRALLGFLQRSRKSGLRLAVVVTGKGNPDNKETAAWSMRNHGVLKEMVPRWLNEPAFSALIAGTAPAHIRHGGGGALYVYLRKPE